MTSANDIEILEEAILLARGLQKKQAEIQLRHLVARGIRHSKAFMALGVLCGERGDLEQRRLWFEQARQLAETAGEQPALRLLLNQSIDSLEQGEPDKALLYGEEAMKNFPEEIEAHLHQARLYANLKHFQEADVQLEKARSIAESLPIDHPETIKRLRLLAQAEQHVGLLDETISTCKTILRHDPNDLPALMMISLALIGQGSIDEAMLWLLNAVAIAPEDSEVLCCYGTTLSKLGQWDEAIHVFRKALELDPAQTKASFGLAGCLMEQGMAVEAETLYKQVLKQHPLDHQCRLGLSITLRTLGDAKAALELQSGLLDEAPDDFGIFSSWMFTSAICESIDPKQILDKAHNFWSRSCPRERVVNGSVAYIVPKELQQPLRVGILSGDIGDHVVGLFLDSLLRHHDPKRCRLELLSMQRRYDKASEDIIRFSDSFYSLEGLTIEAARQVLQEKAFDLIIDTSGYTNASGLQILGERCAPIQAHYIGYHATTGMPMMDAFIGDQETAAPDLQNQFSEELWRLPRTWLAFPRNIAFPEANNLMETDRPVLGSFSQGTKLTDTTLSYWSAALQRVPEAVLVLKSRELRDPAIRQRLEERLAHHGVHPGRITFLSPLGTWFDHVFHYNYLDLALDTTPWSSATTGFEALAMGLPLVAIRGNSMASRMSSSLLKGLGRSDCIAHDPQEFGEIVARLCFDLNGLRQGKQERQIATFNSQLFDGADLANHVTDLLVNLSRTKGNNALPLKV